jgi:hypothetical protein
MEGSIWAELYKVSNSLLHEIKTRLIAQEGTECIKQHGLYKKEWKLTMTSPLDICMSEGNERRINVKDTFGGNFYTFKK